MRKSIKGMIAVAGIVGLLGVAPMAMAKDGDVIKRGSCSGASDWKLKLSPQDGKIEVEFEVDSNRVGQTWQVRLTKNGTQFFSGSQGHAGPERLVHGPQGHVEPGRRRHDPRPCRERGDRRDVHGRRRCSPCDHRHAPFTAHRRPGPPEGSRAFGFPDPVRRSILRSAPTPRGGTT